jgi:hypothetical protein
MSQTADPPNAKGGAPGGGPFAALRREGRSMSRVGRRLRHIREGATAVAAHDEVHAVDEVRRRAGCAADERVGARGRAGRGAAMMAIHRELTASGELMGRLGPDGVGGGKASPTGLRRWSRMVTLRSSRDRPPATGWSTWSRRSGPSRSLRGARAAPGPGGKPLGKEIQVRPVMDGRRP